MKFRTEGIAEFLRQVKRSTTLHILSPAANLTGRAMVTSAVEEWELDVTHLDVLFQAHKFPRIENVQRKNAVLYKQGAVGLPWAEFLLLLCARGFLGRNELADLYSGYPLGGIKKKHYSDMDEVLEDFVEYWPRRGVDVVVIPSLIRRLRRFGFNVKKIVVYNHDLRNPVRTTHANWPVLKISSSGRILQVGPYVGQRSVIISEAAVA